ncbi:MAG TPA: RecX family transcriptional regulator [Clostridia bacterium]|nr:RecX family transcriptional regulator [Clostridia bacterium]
MELDKNDLSKPIKKNDEEQAFQLGVYYLSLRPRTEHEMSAYLTRKGYEDAVIDEVLKKLSHYKYIDDEQYTTNYILSAIEAQKKSSYAVKLELTKKGVPQEIIESCIPIFSYDIDLKIAKKISTEYFYRKSDLPYRQLKNRVSQLLTRKGFSPGIIDDCLNYLEQNKNIQSIVASNKEQYLLQATNLAEKYFLKYSKKEDNPYLLQQKIKHALYRKGYGTDIINLAVENISDKS